MQILHINDKLQEAGGTEIYIRDLIPLLYKNNIKSYWVSINLVNNFLIIKSKNKNIEWNGKLKDFHKSNLYKLVDKNTILHVHNLKEPKIMELLFSLGPVIRHMHTPSVFCPGNDKFWSSSEEQCQIKYGYKCLINAYIKRCCNRQPKRLYKSFKNTSYEINVAKNKYNSFIVNSSFLFNEAIKAGYDKNKINLISYFTNSTNETFFLKNDIPKITFVGRLSSTKGVNYLIEAFSLIIKNIPSAELDIIGRGHSEKSFFLLAEKYSLKNSINFLGWGNKKMIDNHLSNSSVVAFPSVYPESFGIVGIEAMMRGRPVVGFDVGGVKDWLKNEENGFLVKNKNVEGFAEAIIKILENDELRNQMGNRAREIAKLKFSEEVHLNKLLNCYERALKQ